MFTSRFVWIFRYCGLLLLCGAACVARADKLSITSTPAGATIELDGVPVGLTPFEKDFPGGYFHRTRTAIGTRLEHPIIARITLAGYATKELPITQGPMEWVGLNGHHHGEYWLLKSNEFHVDLDPISEVFTGSIAAKPVKLAATTDDQDLPLEDLIAQTKPAVVYLKALEKAGTGFFVTETGVIATNAHVARGEDSLTVLLANGLQLEAKVAYIDADLDIALAKIPGSGFPHLTLAEVSTVRQGESVIAVGNPGEAMTFSVTKGIVSGVGKFPLAGPGTWIQTDAPLNPGNSGGPLLNERGEVIGISTQKIVKKNVSGIGFALSATDLLHVLQRFYPNDTDGLQQLSDREGAKTDSPAPVNQTDFGQVVVDGPRRAAILVDNKKVGYAPAKLSLPAGPHSIVIRRPGYVDGIYGIVVLKDSEVSVPEPQE